MPSALDRDVDILVLGVTGYAGNRIAEQLACKVSVTAFDPHVADLRIGFAGRSRERLESIRKDCSNRVADDCLFVVDTEDVDKLAKVTARSKLLVNCVGPYMEHGQNVLRACLQSGTHYVDLCGEQGWIHEMQTKYHEAAKTKGITMVSACGWDSAPADFLAYHLIDQLTPEEKMQHLVLQNVVYMGQRKRFFGPFSGAGSGTLQTILRGWHTGTGINVRIDPDPVTKKHRILQSSHWLQYFKCIGLYGFASELFSDAYIVRQSRALVSQRDGAEGGHFEYEHCFAAPYAPILLSVKFFLWLMPRLVSKFKWLYTFLWSIAAKSGQGPGLAGRENAMADLHGFLNVYDKISKKLLRTVTATMHTDFDPNDVTSRTVLRIAALILKRPEQRAFTGFLTPAAALGPDSECAAAAAMVLKSTWKNVDAPP